MEIRDIVRIGQIGNEIGKIAQDLAERITKEEMTKSIVKRTTDQRVINALEVSEILVGLLTKQFTKEELIEHQRHHLPDYNKNLKGRIQVSPIDFSEGIKALSEEETRMKKALVKILKILGFDPDFRDIYEAGLGGRGDISCLTVGPFGNRSAVTGRTKGEDILLSVGDEDADPDEKSQTPSNVDMGRS